MGLSYPSKVDDGDYKYSYSGADISLIFLPSGTHSFGFKYVPANGESTLEYNDDAVPSEFVAELGESSLERTNKFKMNEYSAMYMYSFNRFLAGWYYSRLKANKRNLLLQRHQS